MRRCRSKDFGIRLSWRRLRPFVPRATGSLLPASLLDAAIKTRAGKPPRGTRLQCKDFHPPPSHFHLNPYPPLTGGMAASSSPSFNTSAGPA